MQKVLSFFFIVLGISGISFSKPDSLKTYEFSDIVITATKTNTPIREVASSVTVITEKDLSNTIYPYISDILREVPGVSFTQQGGPGKISSLFMRGAKPGHTLILIDGMEMNDPGSVSNSFDFANLQTANIERIEVLRGPQSALYGSDALAGVINIFTKHGNDKPKIIISGEVGSYDSYKGNIGSNGSYGGVNYNLNYSSLYTGGFSAADKAYGNTEKDSYQNNSFFSSIGVSPSENLKLDFVFNYSKSKSDLDQNAKLGDDPNFNVKIEELFFNAGGSLNLFDGLWTQDIKLGFIKNINKTVDDIDAAHPSTSSENYFLGNRLKFEWQNNFILFPDNIFTVGFKAEQEKAYSSYLSASEWGLYSSIIPTNKAVTTGIYLQDQFKLFNSLSSSVGIRYDHHDRFGSVFTYRIAPAYFLSATNTKLKATFGTGFKSPSLYYLFDPVYGNKELEPEKSIGWDAGFEQFLFGNKLSLGFTYFGNKYKDLIGYDENFKTINIDKAETKGLELFLLLAPINNLQINLNYTYTESKDKSTGKEDSGKDMIRIPKNKLSLNMNYSYSKLNVNLSVTNIGESEDKDFSSYVTRRVKLKAHTLVNAAVSYQLLDYLNVYGRVENLFDVDYEEILYYGTPRLSAYGGFRFNL